MWQVAFWTTVASQTLVFASLPMTFDSHRARRGKRDAPRSHLIVRHAALD
jgi:hypothetical protein